MANGEGKRRFLIEIVGDTDQAVASIEKLSNSLKGLQESVKGSTAKTEANLTGVQNAARGVGKAGEDSAASFLQSAAIVAAASIAMKKGLEATLGAAAELELQIDRVNDVIDRTGASTAAMATSFLEAGRPAGELITAAAEFAKVGAVGQEQLTGLADAAFKFGVITDQSASQAAQTISSFALALNVPPERMERLTSSLALLTEKTGVSADSMRRFVNILGPAATQAGVSETAVLGLSARLGQMGILGSRAIPGFLQLFKTLEKRPQKAASIIGVSAEKMQEMLATRPQEAFGMLLAKIKEAGKDAPKLLERLGVKGGFAQIAMQQLAQQGGAVADAMGLAAKGFENTIALEEEFAERSATLAQQMGFLRDQVKALFTRIGSFLVPIVSVLVKGLRALVSVISLIPTPILGIAGLMFGAVAGFVLLANAVVLATNAMKTMITTTRTFMTMIPGLGKMVGKLAPLFSRLGLGLGGGTAGAGGAAAKAVPMIGRLLAALGPVGLIIAAIVAAIAAAMIVVPKIMGMFKSTNKAVRGLGVALAFLFRGLFVIWGIIKAVIFVGKVLISIFAFAVEAVMTALTPAIDALNDAFGALGEAFQPLLDAFGIITEDGDFLSTVLEGLRVILKAVGKVVGFIVAFFIQPLIKAIEIVVRGIAFWVSALKPLFDLIANGIRAVKGAISDFIQFWKDVGSTVGAVIDKITFGLFQSSMFHIVEGVEEILSPLEALLGVFTKIGDFFLSVLFSPFKLLASLFGKGGAEAVLPVKAATAAASAVTGTAVGMTQAVPVVVSGGGPESAAVSRPAMGGIPRIVVVSQLVLDGTIIAEMVKEALMTDSMRLFNDPRMGLRGISG